MTLRNSVYGGPSRADWRCPTFLAASIALTAALSACAIAPKAKAKAAAEKEWGGVRAKVARQQAAQHRTMGRFEDCMRSATESVSLDDGDPEAFVLLAECSLEISRNAAAKDALNAARRRGLESSDLAYLRGVIHELEDDPSGALVEYQKACEQSNFAWDAATARVELLVSLGRIEEAQSVLSNYDGRSDQPPTIDVLRAFVGDVSKVPASAQRSSFIDTEALRGNTILAQEWIHALARSGDCEGANLALLRLDAAKERSPVVDAGGASAQSLSADESALRRELAECFLRKGDPSRAVDLLDRQVPSESTEAATRLILCKAFLALHDLSSAQREWETLEVMAGADSETLFTGAVLAWRNGEFDLALQRIRQSMQLRPNDSDAECLLAEILMARGDRPAALRQFRVVVEKDPDCTWAQFGVALLQSSGG